MIVKMNSTSGKKSQATTLLLWMRPLYMVWTLASLFVFMKILLWNIETPNMDVTTRQQSVSSNQYDFLSVIPKQKAQPRYFPRWGATKEDEERFGIDFGPVLDYIVNCSHFSFGLSKGFRDPEVLYILDHEGLTVSEHHHSIIGENHKNILDYKVLAIERKMVDAWNLWKSDPATSNEQWPLLSRIWSAKNSESSGFPFLLWHGDYTGCNFRNWKGQQSVPLFTLSSSGLHSVPLFTVAASVHCNFTFPFPNHVTVADIDIDWNVRMQEFQLQYPWEQKLPQIVWKGGLTGHTDNSLLHHQRWQMLQRLHEMKQKYETEATGSEMKPFLFNVGATRLPKPFLRYEPFLSEVGGIVESMDMVDFQNYRGVIDLDGFSWSSRFGQLLCYNSVVLKVEPQWVDYFYYPIRNQSDWLQPWVHYIPIKSDLSDLVELSEFVINPANDAVLKEIVVQANDWCRTHFVPRRIATDMLDIWERYVALLNIGDADWSTRQWPDVKRRLLQPGSPWRMDRVIDSSSP